MKVYSLAVVLAPPQKSSSIIISANDMSSFSFYQRGSVGEFLTFFSKTISERTPQGQRQSVQENNYTAHVYNRGGAEQLAGASHTPTHAARDTDNSAAVIITDHEYPVRPAFSLLTKLLDDFTAKVPQTSYANPSAISFPEINTYLQKYQDPRQADAIMKVQQELDETKIILVRLVVVFAPTQPVLTSVCSTRRSSPYWSEARSSMILSTAQRHCRRKARCFTRPRRR